MLAGNLSTLLEVSAEEGLRALVHVLAPRGDVLRALPENKESENGGFVELVMD